MCCEEREDSEHDLTSCLTFIGEGCIEGACKPDMCGETTKIVTDSTDIFLDGDGRY